MSMATRWRFISSNEPGTVVTVYDEASAKTLVRVFQGKLKGSWTVQVDKTGAAPPAKPQAAAPAATAPSAAAENGKRRKPRYKIRVWVTLISGTQSFRAFTREISLGGLSLEHKVPTALLGTFCRIYVHGASEGERIEMRCRVAADPRNPRRIQFLSPEPEALERLSLWIKTFIEQQKAA